MPNGLEDTARLAYSSLSNENTRPVIIIVDALNQVMIITLPMLRLPSVKAHICKDFYDNHLKF